MRDDTADESDNIDLADRELIEKNMTGPKVRAMANCPSSVSGATTRLTKTEQGVELTVTTMDRGGEREIRRSALRLAQVKPVPGIVQHSGRGTGSGRLGYCPVLLADTRVSVEDIEGGARISVRAACPWNVEIVQEVTRARVEALSRKHL